MLFFLHDGSVRGHSIIMEFLLPFCSLSLSPFLPLVCRWDLRNGDVTRVYARQRARFSLEWGAFFMVILAWITMTVDFLQLASFAFFAPKSSSSLANQSIDTSAWPDWHPFLWVMPVFQLSLPGLKKTGLNTDNMYWDAYWASVVLVFVTLLLFSVSYKIVGASNKSCWKILWKPACWLHYVCSTLLVIPLCSQLFSVFVCAKSAELGPTEQMCWRYDHILLIVLSGWVR